MLELVKRHMGGAGVTPHGFRATFSTWVTEQTDTPTEIRELALAHVSGDKVAAACQRSVLLEKRRALMEHWGWSRKARSSSFVLLSSPDLPVLKFAAARARFAQYGAFGSKVGSAWPRNSRRRCQLPLTPIVDPAIDQNLTDATVGRVSATQMAAVRSWTHSRRSRTSTAMPAHARGCAKTQLSGVAPQLSIRVPVVLTIMLRSSGPLRF